MNAKVFNAAKADWQSGRAFWRQTNSMTHAGHFRLHTPPGPTDPLGSKWGKKTIKAPWSNEIVKEFGGPDKFHDETQKASALTNSKDESCSAKE